ncbi:acid phosphatase [Acrocarpospora corrugata]|uniref:Acid phosphatase n=1 Tax=Acrocarpospora corrugata TaxID=35763 RepID=A0A5M3W5F8_9ACTN|nr:metallophosphoesterase [Acrocarpospora corrugata]GES04024.1 acid phosphatase [Acrocarpospora corrugata]
MNARRGTASGRYSRIAVHFGNARRRALLGAALLLVPGCAGSSADAEPIPSEAATVAGSADGEVKPVGFLAVGDAGTGGRAQRRVARAMKRWAANRRVDAIITTGDNVYPDGQPDKIEGVLTKPYADLKAPIWASLGNHDVQAGHGDEQLKALGLPVPPFAKRLPGAEFLFLDANRDHPEQAGWLDRQLSAPGPRLRVVVFHQPAWSCSLHGSTAAVDKYWVPILERHRVALVLNGHDHNYQRFISPYGVNYIVTGGGGAGLYPIKYGCPGLPKRAAARKRHHFLAVQITGDDTLNVSAIGPKGKTFDWAVITR